MKFRELFSHRSITQLIFVLVLFAILIPIAIWDSNTQVKVDFYDTDLSIRSDKYSMSVTYGDIVSAELADLAEPGEKVEDGFDNDIIRTGVWSNDTWGEYYICADLDATNCVVLQLTDGRIFVFSCKNNETTAEYYEQLLPHLTTP